MEWGDCVDETTGVATLRCIPALFQNLINATLMFVGVVAVFMLIWSGYQLVTSGGDPKKIQGGRQTMTYAIIGLVLVISSFAIIAFIGYTTNTSDCINNSTNRTNFLKGC